MKGCRFDSDSTHHDPALAGSHGGRPVTPEAVRRFCSAKGHMGGLPHHLPR